mmetsp:Transcript_863/g.2474  ORF Transcript_863/g.2474 Transcript_863/m.2474 type:complete len:147 (+) Transcript_863:1190-1630(+)
MESSCDVMGRTEPATQCGWKLEEDEWRREGRFWIYSSSAGKYQPLKLQENGICDFCTLHLLLLAAYFCTESSPRTHWASIGMVTETLTHVGVFMSQSMQLNRDGHGRYKNDCSFSFLKKSHLHTPPQPSHRPSLPYLWCSSFDPRA